MYIDFNNKIIEDMMLDGFFGLERENLRVTSDGKLSTLKHPICDEHIDRDFAECQLEFITGICNSSEAVCNELYKLQRHANSVLGHLTKPEFLWPHSNPPFVDEGDDVSIAHFEGELNDKEIYREYLACKYGKRKMLYSGIHYNYSFSDKLLDKVYDEKCYGYTGIERNIQIDIEDNNASISHDLDENDGLKNSDVKKEIDKSDFYDNIYLGTAYRLLGLSWIIVYALSASPIDAFDSEIKYISKRCGKEGYYNDFEIMMNYASLKDYLENIMSYIANGDLYGLSEVYYPIRIKPNGDNTLRSLSEGIDHLELRMIDLNPYSEIGIEKEDVDFIQLLIVYCMSKESEGFIRRLYGYNISDEDNTIKYQSDALDRIKTAAEYKPTKYEFDKQGIELLDELANFYILHNKKNALSVIDRMLEKLLDEELRYSSRVIKDYGESFVDKVMKELIENS